MAAHRRMSGSQQIATDAGVDHVAAFRTEHPDRTSTSDSRSARRRWPLRFKARRRRLRAGEKSNPVTERAREPGERHRVGAVSALQVYDVETVQSPRAAAGT